LKASKDVMTMNGGKPLKRTGRFHVLTILANEQAQAVVGK
jgi:hypothetical protein